MIRLKKNKKLHFVIEHPIKCKFLYVVSEKLMPLTFGLKKVQTNKYSKAVYIKNCIQF